MKSGAIAQLGEHPAARLEDGGSTPSGSTNSPPDMKVQEKVSVEIGTARLRSGHFVVEDFVEILQTIGYQLPAACSDDNPTDPVCVQ